MAVYVARIGEGWEVGVQERGTRDALAAFPDESSACHFALREIERAHHRDRPSRPWWLRWT